MNGLTTYDIDEISAYCDVDTILILRCFSKNMFEKYVLKYFENTKLLSKIVKEEPNDILIYGIYNNSERIVKYAISNTRSVASPIRLDSDERNTMTNLPGMDICRYSFDSACGHSTVSIVKLILNSYTFKNHTNVREYMHIGCMSAFRNKNKEVAKFLIDNNNPINSYLPYEIPTYSELIQQYHSGIINSDELSEKLIENYDERYDMTHGAIFIP